MPSSNNGRERYANGFQTPGMLKIIADVHELVDEHRVRNGQEPWDWNLKNLIDKGARRFPRTGWIAKFIISNGFHKRPAKPIMIPKCTNSDCQLEIQANNKLHPHWGAYGDHFGARFDEATGKWLIFCEKHASAQGLPIKTMTPARAWVLTGGAAAHREEQKAQELAEAKK